MQGPHPHCYYIESSKSHDANDIAVIKLRSSAMDGGCACWAGWLCEMTAMIFQALSEGMPEHLTVTVFY